MKPFQYRHILRTMPKALRRKWWEQRKQLGKPFDAMRVGISSAIDNATAVNQTRFLREMGK